MSLRPASGFRLKTVVRSHGWFDLPPFEWRDDRLRLVGRVGNDGRSQKPITLWIEQSGEELLVDGQVEGRWSRAQLSQAERIVEQSLGLRLDFAEFHRIAGDRFAWAKEIGAGALLRSASVFEDAVKMLATTNCSWSLTRRMVAGLMEELGEPAPGGARAFPTAQAMASASVEFYRERARTGYRASFFRQFASQVVEGTLDVEHWASFEGSTAELIRDIRRAPGLGPYAAENLCKLFGRFDGLALDSWCVNKFTQTHGRVRGDVAKAIRRFYEPYGQWRGLALWLDLTKDWHQGKEDGASMNADESIPR